MNAAWKAILVAAAVLWASSLWGAEQKEEEKEIATVVVTATRTKTPVEEVSTSVTVISEDEIRSRQDETVGEVLRSVPGLQVVRAGARGAVTTVFIRGAESDHTLVLVDGVEVNSVTLGSFDFADLTTESVERIEVVRGSGATLYGSQAIGGVINIITKRGAETPAATLSIEGGSGSTHREAATVSGSQGIASFWGSAAYLESEGFRPVNDDHRNFAAAVRTDLAVSESGVLRGVFRYSGTESGLFNNNNFAALRDPDARTKRDLLLAKGEWEQELGGGLDYRVAGSYTRENFRFFDEPDRFDAFPSLSRIPTEIASGEFQGNYYWHDSSVTTFGFEFEDRMADVRSDFGGFQTRFDQGRNNFAYYAQEQLRLFGERVFIVGGFRLDDNEDFGTEISPAWSLAYRIRRTGTKLKAGFSEGFKAPNFNELFFPNFGNPVLEPEQSAEWNAGFEQSLWGDLFSFEAVYFRRRVRGLIEAVLVDPETFTFQAQNFGRVDVEGVEVISVLRLGPALALSANFTYLDFDTRDERLLRRPRERANVGLSYLRDGVFRRADVLNVNLTLDVVGGRDDVDPIRGPAVNPMYAKADLALSYTFAPRPSFFGGLTAYCRVENVLDRDYREALGFDAPPVNFMVGVRVTFR